MKPRTTKPHDDFTRRLITFALPILLLYLVISSLNMVDNVMVGRLGDVSISAVAHGNQMYLVASLFTVG